MNPIYPFVSARAGERCEYCKYPERLVNFHLEIDHHKPLSAGGTNDPENLVLACRSCNAYKSAHQIGLLANDLTVRLFNPRIDVWIEHFRLDAESGEISGLTQIGIGTVRRMRINSPAQLRTRRFWINRGESWV